MSASSSSASVELCIVCDQPGTKLCGACKQARFCSARCQRKIWPVHKVQCGRDPDSFHLPPLTSDELDELERIKDEPVVQNLSTQTTLTLTYFGIDWSTFISVVSSATAAPRNDRARVELILFAQYHLFKARARGVSPTVGKDTVWRNFGHMAFNTIAVSVREDKRRPPPHWEPFEAIRLLDNVLRRQLVWSAVLQDGPKSMEEDPERLDQALAWLYDISNAPTPALDPPQALVDSPSPSPSSSPPRSSRPRALAHDRLDERQTTVPLWPSHKALCRRNSELFQLPPLSSLELEKLRAIKDKPYGASGQSLVYEVLEEGRGGSPDRVVEAFWFAVSMPADSDPTVEDIRVAALLLAYEYLHRAKQEEKPADLAAPALTCWEAFAPSASSFRLKYLDTLDTLDGQTVAQAEAAGRGPLVVLNDILRQELVHATLCAHVMQPKPSLTIPELRPLLRKGYERLLEAVDAADMSPVTKKAMREFSDTQSLAQAMQG
ncbi:hypothetical protein JCM8208_001236 [Rhodotorula glutinis]